MRFNDLVGVCIVFVGIVIMGWVALSWLEVIAYNLSPNHEYCSYNLFQMLVDKGVYHE